MVFECLYITTITCDLGPVVAVCKWASCVRQRAGILHGVLAGVYTGCLFGPESDTQHRNYLCYYVTIKAIE